MKLEFIASFAAAVVLHLVLLFGFRIGSMAKPLPMSNDPSPVDVNLVEAAPPSPTVAAPPPEPTPAPTSESMPTPVPEATPAPMPAPEAMQSPEPSATPVPEPPRANPKPHPSASKPARKATGSTQTSFASVSSGSNLQGSAATMHARYRSNPRPEYPIEARRLHEQGVVLLSVAVGADGQVTDVTLKRSSGFSSLDEAAMQAVRRWIFEPARVGGLTVSSHADVPVRFSLAE